jgi:hypothetical protein
MKYTGFIRCIGDYGDQHLDHERGFDTPEEAFKWAKNEAFKTGSTSIGSRTYWVEYERSNIVEGFWKRE